MKIIKVTFNENVETEEIELKHINDAFSILGVVESQSRLKAMNSFDLKKPYVVKTGSNQYSFVSNKNKEFEKAAIEKAKKKYISSK
jgi:hypothetical protein